MDRVSVLLGHSSIKVTGKHHSPWVRARQEQLEADVRRTWGVPVAYMALGLQDKARQELERAEAP